MKETRGNNINGSQNRKTALSIYIQNNTEVPINGVPYVKEKFQNIKLGHRGTVNTGQEMFP
jgi:hypothetical protein